MGTVCDGVANYDNDNEFVKMHADKHMKYLKIFALSVIVIGAGLVFILSKSGAREDKSQGRSYPEAGAGSTPTSETPRQESTDLSRSSRPPVGREGIWGNIPLEKMKRARESFGGITDSTAVRVGKRLSANQCRGEGAPYKLSVLPMKPEDFSHIVPYGIMIGAHVTPVDHQYFSPMIFRSPKDTYEVRAMADSDIVGLEIHPPQNGSNGRIRLVFSITCTYFYYYDLVTSVVPKIDFKNLPVPVKAGEVIGRIGGQTLDFAVWDTTRPLPGFVAPSRYYDAEPWKIYTADPLEYYAPDIRATALSKYVRQADPRSGKIDYDVDGTLAGNWFREGTGGYGGLKGEGAGGYWTGHLSFAPDWYDPSIFYISVGYLASENGAPDNQFLVPRGAPGPAQVNVDSGLVKYPLTSHWSWRKTDGTTWDNMSFADAVTVDDSRATAEGCALVQMVEARKLTFETFLKKDCGSAGGFTSAAKTYTR